MESFNFEKLNVYKESLSFVEWVYKVASKWPKAEAFALTDQIKRAAISIVLNIAEGSSRTKLDFKHFLSTSRGSVYECVAVLTLAINLKYITKDEYDYGYQSCNKLARMLSALKNSLK